MNFTAMTTTQAVDAVYLYIFGFCIVLLVGITATMVFFVLKYNRKSHPVPEPTADSNVWLETVWFLIPTLIALSMFWFGWKGYERLADIPAKAMVVHVTGRQWSWSFQYANGKTSDKLYVPVNKPVQLDLTSLDVIHSFFVPAFRIKKDVVPGMTTHEWFEATREGSYDAFCAQYCGVGHSQMTTKVVAMAADKFEKWYQTQPAVAEGGEGRRLLQKYGCTGCHSLDGSKKIGPTLKGIYGSKVTVLTGGKERTLTVGESYIKRSIEEPKADVVKGFAPVMPSFKGRISETEIDEIIDFLQKESGKSAAGKSSHETKATRPAAAATGKKLVGEKGCATCHSTDGSKKIGPTWKGLYGSDVAVTTNGKDRTVKADESYLIRSIVHPRADIVKGFPPVMPPFADLSKQQLESIVAYLKTLR